MALDIQIKKRLDGFVLDIELVSEGNRFSILGASGSGKSMLLKMIAGVMMPDEGHMIVDGVPFFDSEKKINLKARERHVGYLFQNYALFPNMTVEKNIGVGIRCKKEEKVRRTAALIREYHLEGLEKRYPGTLSGGQQQRVALARMMASEPGIILMDEPYSALDAFLKHEMQREMMAVLEKYDGNLILVSHNSEEAYRFGQEVMILHDGKKIQMAEREQIFVRPESLQAARLVGFDWIAAGEKAGSGKVYIPDWGISLDVHQEVPETPFYVAVRSEGRQLWDQDGVVKIPSEKVLLLDK